MRVSRWVIGATITLAASQVGCTSSATSETVDEFFRGFIRPNEPGAVVLVVKDGEIAHRAAYGLANLEKGESLSTAHTMHIASTGKQMTSLAVLLLAEQGSLELDDPVGKHISELAHFGDAFTIRRLLTHTSGLPDYEGDLMDALLARSKQPTNADLVAVLAGWQGLPESPGTTFEYSNPGYDLLGTVVERVGQASFPAFLESRIFGPLAMSDTFSLPNDERRAAPLVAMSYSNENGPVEPYPTDPLDGLVGAGSVYTTASDMALYDRALRQGTLLSTETLANAFQPVQLNGGATEPYGFGWELESWREQAYVAHSGAWLGFTSDYVRFLDRHLSVLVMFNRDYGYPDDPRIALRVAQFFSE